MTWPDIVIGFVVMFGALKGFKRGLINELTGAVALAFGIAAAFAYAGTFDAFVRGWTHLGAGSSHIVGMVLYAALAYAIILAVGGALSSVAKLPVIGSVNALLGACAGSAKAAVLAWSIVYVALFFPLSGDVRSDLHRSQLVALLQRPNASLDERLRRSLPPFVEPFAAQIFERHHV